jgi:hypothetical protein
MAQILRFPKSNWPLRRVDTLSHLIEAVSCHRHAQEDVYWLKENAELLNVLECTKEASGAGVAVGGRDLDGIALAVLAPLRAFYAGADRHLCFFRQYYRFVLSICMDLEDLGLVRSGVGSGSVGSAGKGEALARWVIEQGLPSHELSDLQRAEARRLLARRGLVADFPGLDERLHAFVDESAQFAVPNRKAAYELTHIVFYLSDYGRRSPGLSPAAVQSLTHVGLLAFLDQDADLLSEICISLRYCGQTPSAIWEDWLARHHQGFTLMEAGRAAAPPLHRDDYHMFLVSSWHQALYAGSCFYDRIPSAALRFQRPAEQGVLHHLSQAVFQAGSQAGDWQALRPLISAGLSESAYELLCAAERSSVGFETFFEAFARSGTTEGPIARVNSG